MRFRRKHVFGTYLILADFFNLAAVTITILPIHAYGLLTMDDIWTEETEDKLIDLWQETDCLYAITSGGYREREKTQFRLVANSVHTADVGFRGWTCAHTKVCCAHV